ncbi:MAG: glycosyltransferase [Rubripirellula sp.]
MGVDRRLMSLKPDVWVTMGVGKESAGVIATAAAQGRPSVLMIRSGADLDARYAENEITHSPYGERSDVCRFAIEQADEIVCQTDVQLERLQKLFGRKGSLIRNSLDIDRWKVERDKHARRHVLWIGRYEEFAKRIQLAIQIAKACPEIPIRMIVNPDDPTVEKRVRSSLPSNVELVDYIPFDEMPLQFAQATAFLSTSSAAAEGFPNALLQAAASGTPIVTLQDFDRFFAKSSAGVVCGDDVANATERLTEFHTGKRIHAVAPVDEYLTANHSIDWVTDRFSSLLSDVFNRTLRTAAS